MVLEFEQNVDEFRSHFSEIEFRWGKGRDLPQPIMFPKYPFGFLLSNLVNQILTLHTTLSNTMESFDVLNECIILKSLPLGLFNEM